MKKKNTTAYIAWIAISIIWGTTYLAIRIGVADLPPMLFAGFRWIAAGLILVSIRRLMGNKLPPKNEIKHLAVVGIALLGIANGLVVVAEQWIPSGLAALVITTLPFWMVGFESLLPKGPNFNRYIFIGLLLGLSGCFYDVRKRFAALDTWQLLTWCVRIDGCGYCLVSRQYLFKV